MAQQKIYNEGRVVGLSAYELYLRQHNSVNDPNVTPPASESEWLASSIASGNSMLLRLTHSDYESGTPWGHAENNEQRYIDIQLPENSRLCAANVIIGSWFAGGGYIPDDNGHWAVRASSGPLVDKAGIGQPNIESVYKDSESTIQPSGKSLDEGYKKSLTAYSKIIDGIVIQPGEWKNQDVEIGDDVIIKQRSLSPDLTKSPRVRILMTDIEEGVDLWILLTGFTDRTIIAGTSGTDMDVNTSSPQNGDFLGPAVFPSTAQIIFTTPVGYINTTIEPNMQDLTDINTTRQDNKDAYPKYLRQGRGSDAFATLALPKNKDGDIDIKYKSNVNPLFLDGKGYLSWDILLEALWNNKPIDITQYIAGPMLRGQYGVKIDQNTNRQSTISIDPNLIQSGNGIQVSRDSTGQFTIINTMPDLRESEFISLKSTDYLITWGPRQRPSYNDGYYVFQGGNKGNGYGVTTRNDNGTVSTRVDDLDISVLPIIDDGQVVNVYLKIRGYKGGGALSCEQLAYWGTIPGYSGGSSSEWHNWAALNHSNKSAQDADQWNASIICCIHFDSNVSVTTKQGKTVNIDFDKFINNAVDETLQYDYNSNHYQEYDFGGNKVWNIYGYAADDSKVEIRGSWPVHCRAIPSIYTDSEGYTHKCICIQAVSMYDGYNNQFYACANHYSGNKSLTKSYLTFGNMTVGGILF